MTYAGPEHVTTDLSVDLDAEHAVTSLAQPAPEQRRAARRPAALAVRQVLAIDTWNATLRAREPSMAPGSSRDDRLEASRRREVLHRAHAAMVAQAGQSLSSGDMSPMPLSARATAVIAHRHPWIAARIGAALEQEGVCVVACLENGADALGVVVAEQPALLFAGEHLAMMTGLELLSQAAVFAPGTLLATQAAHSGPALVDAGADLVLPSQHTADTLAAALVALAREWGLVPSVG